MSAAALRLGTRGSPLVLRQAELVAEAIEGPVETVVLRTGGDLGAGGEPEQAAPDNVRELRSGTT